MAHPHLTTKQIAVGGAILAVIVTYIGFQQSNIKRDKPPEYTTAESTCLKVAATQFQRQLDAQANQDQADRLTAIDAYGANKSQPALDASMAAGEYKHRIASLQLDESFCAAQARCLSTKPYKETFDACYEVLADQSDEKKD